MRRLGTLLLAIGAVISAMPAIGHAESVLTRHVRQETVNGEARLSDGSPPPRPCALSLCCRSVIKRS